LLEAFKPADDAPQPAPVAADYNDGNWHYWHGGKCPVHPDSVVEVRFANGPKCNAPDLAGKWYWLHDGDSSDIHQFRVVTPYVEPAPDQRDAHIAAHDAWFAGRFPHNFRDRHTDKLSADFYKTTLRAWLAAMAQKGGE
jgi:hypothetical protein